jgi:GNAT superfamily N-acetyltransferase
MYLVCGLGTDGEKEGELMGYVCLMMPITETGPFRGEVNKLMVSPNHRRKGVARRVMEKMEDVGRQRGRTLLVSFFYSNADALIICCVNVGCLVDVGHHNWFARGGRVSEVRLDRTWCPSEIWHQSGGWETGG